MTAVETTLLAMCEANPADDAPRMVWADEQGGERGELVNVQCALARGGLPADQSGQLRVRQRELLAAHGATWSGLAPYARRCWFRRGFAELATMEALLFVNHAEEIFAAAPLLSSIELTDVDAIEIADLIDHAMFSQLRGLRLPRLPAETMQVLIDARAFAKLDALGLFGINNDQAAQLGASGQLERVKRLDVWVNVEALPALLAGAPNLHALHLTRGDNPWLYVKHFTVQPSELAVHAGALPELSATPLAARIEKLSLFDRTMPTEMPALIDFERVWSLDVDLPPRMTLDKALARGELARIRELRATNLTPETALAIADALGEQLELFELVDYAADISPLCERVRGCVVATPRNTASDAPDPPPLFADVLPDAPLWAVPTVKL